MPPEQYVVLLEKIARLETHMENMAENQMGLSIKLDDFMSHYQDSRNKGSKDIADMKSNLKWLWVSGGIVVTGIGIAIGELWKKVF